MLIATVSVGDHIATLSSVAPKTKNDEVFYHFTVTDQFNDKTYTKVTDGEARALGWFAAWIIADEPENVQAYVDQLYADAAMKPFLP